MNQADRTCQDIIARLLTALREGEDLSPEDRAHAASCPECNRLLSAAKRLQEELASEAPSAVGIEDEQLAHVTLKAEGTLKKARRLRAALLVFAALIVAGAWLFGPVGGMLGVPEKFVILAVVLLAIVIAVVIVLVLRRLNAGQTKRKLYKRLKPGCMLSGVCLGLAEATGVPVALIRFTFIVLTVAGGKIGIPFYFILSAALDVHPDDRQYMLKFKIQRWMKYLFSHSDSHPTHD